MHRFELKTQLPVSPSELACDALTMVGVNYELGPALSMSVPRSWQVKPLTKWPMNQSLFTSTIMLFGFIPIDRHHFMFTDINALGFTEASKSMLNLHWSHKRLISHNDIGCTVRDVVIYKSKLSILGKLLMPVYQAIFKHRHKRLRARYAK